MLSTESTPYCEHPNGRYRIAEGFETSRVLFEIQIYDRYFNINVDSLATSWAGRWILLRNGHWMRALLASCTRRQIKSFRLIDAPDGRYNIKGGCYPDPGELSSAEVQECNLGRLLLAEKSGEWRPFFAFIWCHLVRRLKSSVRLVLR